MFTKIRDSDPSKQRADRDELKEKIKYLERKIAECEHPAQNEIDQMKKEVADLKTTLGEIEK